MTDDIGRMTENSIQDGCRGPVIHRAGWVVIDPWTIYPNGFVRVRNGCIQEIGQGTSTGGDEVRDHGDGVIFPALVAHSRAASRPIKGLLSGSRT